MTSSFVAKSSAVASCFRSDCLGCKDSRPAVRMKPYSPCLPFRKSQYQFLLRAAPSSSSSSDPSSSSSASSTPKAHFVASRKESVSVSQLERPLIEYMRLPASQYSVLDADRIERVDENTFRCFIKGLNFFQFEVSPVLLVRVEAQPNGCCLNLLSCKLEGSQIVRSQNDKFSASMINNISCDGEDSSSQIQQLTSDTTIEVTVDIPFPFRIIPVSAIESTGTNILSKLLDLMLPRFMSQLVKDYQAWASGDESRRPLGNGEI